MALNPSVNLAAYRWLHLYGPAMSGAENMAMDDALLQRAARTGECVLRVYTWTRPTLSLGRNQAARGRIDPLRAATLGVDIVRRPTGGRALLHHREVTYSVTAPLERDASARAWYDAIGGVLLDALLGLGVPARLAMPSGRTPLPHTAACFQRPDAGEIVVHGRKLVGSALLRREGGLLQHGSILLEDDQPMLTELLPPDEARPEPAGTLREALGEPPGEGVVARALLDALSRRAGGRTTRLLPDEELETAALIARARYTSDAWTFRE